MAFFARVRPGGSFVIRNAGGALRPNARNAAEPCGNFPSKEALARILATSELAAKAAVAKEGKSSKVSFHVPTLPSEPNVKIEDSGRACEHRDCLTFKRDGLGIDFGLE